MEALGEKNKELLAILPRQLSKIRLGGNTKITNWK